MTIKHKPYKRYTKEFKLEAIRVFMGVHDYHFHDYHDK